jgi:hypothetical protein
MVIVPDITTSALTCTLVIVCDNCICENFVYPLITPNQTKKIFELDDWKFILHKIKTILSIVKFDKFQSRLTTKPIKNDMVIITDFLMEDIINAHKSYDQCCVCFEFTKRKNMCCSGFLCGSCYNNIKPKLCSLCTTDPYTDDCETNNCGERPCPLCRKSLSSLTTFVEEAFFY